MLSPSRLASVVSILLAVAASAAALSAIAEEPTDLTMPLAQVASPPVTDVSDADSPAVVSEIAKPDVPTRPQPSPFGGPLCKRTKLAGDCFCILASHGITLDVSTTQFYQGVTNGGLEQSFPYGGRNDYFLNMDGGKLGLWKGSFITLHGESRYGESANLMTGALMPVNMMLMVPQPIGSVSGLSGVKLTQFLSEDVLQATTYRRGHAQRVSEHRADVQPRLCSNRPVLNVWGRVRPPPPSRAGVRGGCIRHQHYADGEWV
jgi:porin